ncbi:putative alpha beta hydrolase fold-3 domain-containing protein [Cladorrhinum sp. PSN259]|nr:putative alpha beta hydrolase fold-3 domain-containing protein [Cladorrhinum sp. PSN259]
MEGGTFWTHQPGFFLYTAYTLVKALVKLPVLLIYYMIHPACRPVRQWTVQQAFGRAMTRFIFEYASKVEFTLGPRSLEPGKEKERFVTIKPYLHGESSSTETGELPRQQESIYQGVAQSPDPAIQPVKIGGTWYPAPLAPESYKHQPGRRIFLHFHGGAYVIFDCRDRDVGFGAKLLLQAAGDGSAVFAPQYRLASVSFPNGRFPAALQDAITAYAHLVFRLNVPGKDVIITGDSAGGNLALALLRYLTETGTTKAALPQPGGVLLFSPWTDLTVTSEAFSQRENERLDMVPPRLLDWAYRVFLPLKVNGDPEGADPRKNAYISPNQQAIETQVPIWVQWGARESLKEDIQAFIEVQKRAGGRLATFEIKEAPHDMFMAGEGLGFQEDAKKAAEHAIQFLDGKI